MRVLVCGGRDFGHPVPVSDPLHQKRQHEWIYLHVTLNQMLGSKKRDVVLITGNAKGADQQAEIWAEKNGVRNEIYPANWKLHGKAAGPIRNKQMLEEGKPDWVIAFPGGNGTEHMCRIARNADVKVTKIPYEEITKMFP